MPLAARPSTTGRRREIEQTKRRIMGCSDCSAEQQRVCGAVAGRELDEAVADQVALFSRRPHAGRRPRISDPVRLQGRNDENAGRRKRERLGITNLHVTRPLQNEMNGKDLEHRKRHPPACLDPADREGVGCHIQGCEEAIKTLVHDWRSFGPCCRCPYCSLDTTMRRIGRASELTLTLVPRLRRREPTGKQHNPHLAFGVSRRLLAGAGQNRACEGLSPACISDRMR